MLIREAEEKDVNALSELTSQLGYPSEADDICVRLKNLLLNPKNRVFVAEKDFLADSNNSIAGFIRFAPYETIYCDAGINITGFAVDEKLRRTGIGRSLMEAVERYAAQNGFAFIRAESVAMRKDAHSVYRKLNFDSEKTQIRFLKKIE